MKSLRISNDLALPLDKSVTGAPGAIVQKYAFLGRTGSGKTYAAKKLAETMLDAGAQIVILDTAGPWAGLRLGPKPFAIPVFGGLFGDVPLDPGSGAAIADVIADRRLCAVLDVSQMIEAEQLRFATAFGTRFFERKKAAPSAVHLFLEEAQELVPQNTEGRGGGIAQSIHVFNRIVKIGRNYGIGVSLISQRPQEINKKALNQTECLFAFQMTGMHERKAVAAWTAEHGVDVDLAAVLPKLEVGQAHVWSPQWLGISRQVRIDRIRTTDTSSAPDFDDDASVTQRLSPIELGDLGKELASAVALAEAADPKAMKKRLAELERDLVLARGTPHQPFDMERVERRLEDELNESLSRMKLLGEQSCERIRNVLVDERVMTGDIRRNGVPESWDPARPKTDDSAHRASRATPTQAEPLGNPIGDFRPVPPKVVHRDTKPTNGKTTLPKAERRILTALAQHGALSLTQAAIICGYSSKSGGMRNTAGYLRSLAFVTGGNDLLEITAAGREALGKYDRLPTGRALADHWYGQLPKAEREILALVVAAYPRALPLQVAAERCGYSATSGGVRNAAGKLRTLDLVEGGNDGMVANKRLVG